MSMNYTNLLSPSMREKPRFMALASAVLIQVSDLFALYENLLPEAFSLSSAEGFQLDTLGALAGVPRPGQFTSDEDYRLWLISRIALNHWSGRNEDLPAVLAAAFPGREARMLDNLDGTVSGSISGDLPFPLSSLLPVPAGIRLVES